MMMAQVIRNAKLWCDVESAEEAERLSNEWEYSLVPELCASAPGAAVARLAELPPHRALLHGGEV